MLLITGICWFITYLLNRRFGKNDEQSPVVFSLLAQWPLQKPFHFFAKHFVVCLAAVHHCFCLSVATTADFTRRLTPRSLLFCAVYRTFSISTWWWLVRA